MSLNDVIEYNADVRTVVGVQFGLLSPNEIIEQSVVEVINPINNVDSKTVGTILDPAFGVVEKDGEICPICKQTSLFCQGHFGFMRMAKPVVQTQFINMVITKLLKCICHRCSSILIDKTTDEGKHVIDSLLKKSEQNRLNLFSKHAKRAKRYCPICGANVPISIKPSKESNKIGKLIVDYKTEKKEEKEEVAELEEVEITEPEKVAKPRTVGTKRKKDEIVKKDKYTIELNQEQYLNLFKQMTNEDCELLGFNHVYARPEWMIWEVMPIPPLAMRPSVAFDGGKMAADDLTTQINAIVRNNVELLTVMRDVDGSGTISQSVKDNIENLWALLQHNISSYLDNTDKNNKINPAVSRSGRKLRGLIDRLIRKKGRIRSNLMAKRVNYSARSVISPDVGIDIDELGVPILVAKKLQFPEIVNSFNYEKLNTMLKNTLQNLNTYPSIVMIKKKKDLNAMPRLVKHFRNATIEAGDTVYRDLMDGDIVMFNRQPTLHKMSMLMHRVKVFRDPNIKSFRLNVSSVEPYNADFDGDEMNMHVPHSMQAIYELMQMYALHKQLVDPQSSQPMIGLIQDGIIGMYDLSINLDKKIDIQIAQMLLNLSNQFIGNLPIKTQEKEKKGKDGNVIYTYSTYYVTQRDLLNKLLPQLTYKKREDNLEIINGKFMSGHLTKAYTGASKHGNLFHVTWLDYGAERVKDLVNDFTRISTAWLLHRGYSIGLKDVTPEQCLYRMNQEEAASLVEFETSKEPKKREILDKLFGRRNVGVRQLTSNTFKNEIYKTHMKHIDDIVKDMFAKSDNLINSLYDGSLAADFINFRSTTTFNEFELRMSKILSDTKNVIAGYIWDCLEPDENRGFTMIDSGAKASKSDIMLIMGFIGQQEVDGGRLPPTFDGRRPSPYTYKDDVTPIGRGFVINSNYNGLSPYEYIGSAVVGRNSVISTAIKTAETGYIQRRLIKNMEDNLVLYDFTVRNETNNIISFIYGGDGFDPTKLERCGFDFVNLRQDQLLEKYAYGPAFTSKMSRFLTNDVIKELTSNKENKEEFEKIAKEETSEIIKRWLYFRGIYNISSDDISYINENNFVDEMTFDKITRSKLKTSINSQRLMLPVNFARLNRTVCEKFELSKFKRASINPIVIYTRVKELIDEIKLMYPIKNNIALYDNNQLVRFNIETAIRTYMASKRLIKMKFNNSAFEYLIHDVKTKISKSIIAPGTSVGIIAGHSIGSTTTQMTMDVFHNVGVNAKANVSMGVPRIQEILNISQNPSAPSLDIVVDFDYLYSLNDYKKCYEEQNVENISEAKLLEKVEKMMDDIAKYKIEFIKNNITYTSLEDVLTEIKVMFKTPNNLRYVSEYVDHVTRFMYGSCQNDYDKITIKFNVNDVHFKKERNSSYTIEQITNIFTPSFESRFIIAGTSFNTIRDYMIKEVSNDGNEVKSKVKKMLNNLIKHGYVTIEDSDIETNFVNNYMNAMKIRLTNSAMYKNLTSSYNINIKYNSSKNNEWSYGRMLDEIWKDEKKNVNRDVDNIDELKWIIELTFNKYKLEKNDITLPMVKNAIHNAFLDNSINAKYYYNSRDSEKLNMALIIEGSERNIMSEITLITHMLKDVKIKGINGITKCFIEPVMRRQNANMSIIDDLTVVKDDDILYFEKLFAKKQTLIIDTDGSNLLQMFGIKHVDSLMTVSDNITEIYNVLGIEAARTAIVRELVKAFEDAGTSVGIRHFKLLADTMTRHGIMMSVDRHGTNKGDNGPYSKMSFEENGTKIAEAGIFARKDRMDGVSGNIMFGQRIKNGTNMIDLIFDEKKYIKSLKVQQIRSQIPKYNARKFEKYDAKVVGLDEYCKPENFEFKTMF